ncbi:MAG: DUF190 domain-containing protein [Acidobacteriia bacterium]|nr:DUF190 domain-containing protein [Terriglobia bacterium]
MKEAYVDRVYRGILGYGAKGHQHKKSFFPISKDLPIMISVIDSSDKVATAAEAVQAMMGDGLLVISDVEFVRLMHSPLKFCAFTLRLQTAIADSLCMRRSSRSAGS